MLIYTVKCCQRFNATIAEFIQRASNTDVSFNNLEENKHLLIYQSHSLFGNGFKILNTIEINYTFLVVSLSFIVENLAMLIQFELDLTTITRKELQNIIETEIIKNNES